MKAASDSDDEDFLPVDDAEEDSGSVPLLSDSSARSRTHSVLLSQASAILGSDKDDSLPLHEEIAATYVEDALHLRKMVPFFDRQRLRLYRIYHSAKYRRIYVAIVFLHLSLAYAEPPTNIVTVPIALVTLIEMLCLINYTLDLLFWFLVVGKTAFLRDKWVRARLLILPIMYADVLVAFATNDSVRFSRWLRPFFLMDKFRNVRKILSSILKSVPGILKVTVLIAFHTTIFGLFAFIVFGDSGVVQAKPLPPAGACENATQISTFMAATNQCDNYFFDLWESLLLMFTLLTTVNFPDIMLPAFRYNGPNSLFFMLFLLIGLFFLMSLILAVVYMNYDEQSKTKITNLIRRRTVALQRSFAVLDSEHRGFIDREQMTAVIRTLRPDLDDRLTNIMFRALDVRRNGKLEEDEYRVVLEFVRVHARDADLRDTSSLPQLRQWALVVATHPGFVAFFDLLVIFSGVRLYLRLAPPSQAVENFASDDNVLYAILAVFVVEQLVKIFALRWKRYWSSGWNRLDFVAIFASVIAELARPPNSSAQSGSLSQVALMARLLRLGRILRVLKVFSLIFTTLRQLLPTLLRYVAILFAVFYTFSIIGMDLFAFTMAPSDPRVANSSYGFNDYYALNFDDLNSVLVMLFHLMVVNNWPIVMEGCVAANGKAARFYFVAFYFVSVVVVVNVVVAFIVDSFIVQYDDNALKQQGGKERWRLMLEQAEKEIAAEEQSKDALDESDDWQSAYIFTRGFSVMDVSFAKFRDELEGEPGVELRRVAWELEPELYGRSRFGGDTVGDALARVASERSLADKLAD